MWLTVLIFVTISNSYMDAVNVSRHDMPEPDWFLEQLFNNSDVINLKGKQNSNC